MSLFRRRPDEALPLSRQKPVAEDVRREVEAHLELRAEELIAQGWEPEAARAESRRAFGEVGAIESECREITTRARRAQRRAELLDAFWQDLVYAGRVLRGAPGFAAAAILTLALGIGANTAIFSVVNGVLLRPLPYERPERLVDLVELHERGYASVPWTSFLDLQAQSRSFEALAEYGGGRGTIQGADEPVRAAVAPVSRDFFRVMRTRAWIGRLPGPGDHAEGAAPVAVVSYRFWRSHLGGDRDLSGKRLRGEFGFDVIGVLPPGFDFPGGTDIWHPLELNRQPTSRTAHNWPAIGRLKPGVSPRQAEEELRSIFRRIGESAGPDFDAVGARVTPLQELLTGSVRRPLFLLLGASALLLLAACTNLASTLLARGTARASELAIRTALGAGRLRIVRQVFTESLVIAVLGCAAGLLVASLLLRALLALAPVGLMRLGDARLDPWVLGFTVAVGLTTAVLFGLFPALRISDVDSGAAMREGARAGGGPRRQRLWSLLVSVEVALALVLLAGSGLMLRSFATVLGIDPGFRADSVLTVELDLPEREYPDVVRAVAFHDRALEALRRIPGVEAAGVSNVLPLGGDNPSGGIQVEGKALLPVGHPITGFAVYRLASTGYFEAMGMRIVRGRGLSEGDVAGAAPAIVVNEALAADGWPGQDPIGKRLRIGGMDGPGAEPWATVVGVVRNVPGSAVTSPARPTYYYSYRQLPYRARWMTAVIRTRVPPLSIAPQVRAALREIDPAVPAEFRTMEERLATSIADRRFTMAVLGAFAGAALLLAAVGIYGVVSYAVAQRTREIGIRIALGARPRTVARMVQGRAMLMVGVGIVLGIAGALALTRVMRSQLYEVSPTDPGTFAAAIVVLGAAGWLASWIPARRGTRVDPMVAIRTE